jgi:polar amino acid transport system substrate-binding protein
MDLRQRRLPCAERRHPLGHGQYSSNPATPLTCKTLRGLLLLLHFEPLRQARECVRRHSVALLLLLGACGLPRDSESTLERARRGALRVGVAHNPPWTTVSAGDPQGVEVSLVSEIAREAGTRIQWVSGAESELLLALKEHKLDLVIGGLTADLPWKTEVGFTRPYYEDKAAKKDHVLAVAPGENALLVHVERTLLRRKSSIPSLLRELP